VYSGTQRTQNIFNTKYNASSIPQEAKFKLYSIEDQTDLKKKYSLRFPHNKEFPQIFK